jgi:beta-glucanase (GH16 family)
LNMFSVRSRFVQGSLMALVVCLIWLGQGSGVRASALRSQGGPPGGPAAWHLDFDDEFSGTSLDTTRWQYCYSPPPVGLGCSGGGNGEMNWYVQNAISVHDGYLWIEAQHQPVQTTDGETLNYTSGLIETWNHYSFTYGYIEARFKVPAGTGLWPAFWAMPADHASNPELDAMEIRGQYPNILWMTLHYYDQLGNVGSDYREWQGPNFSAGYHTIGVDWEPDSLTWYVDGVALKRITHSNEIPKKPMVLILNLAVGGDWNGPPDANTPFPSDFSVDYVRVWQHGAATTTTPTQVAVAANTPPVPATTNSQGGADPSFSASKLFFWIAGGSMIITILIFITLFASRRFRGAAS